MPANGVAVYGNMSGQLDSAANLSSCRNLRDKYLKVFFALRGGNHPYMEKYKAHFDSMNEV
jgi:hypothetical protein